MGLMGKLCSTMKIVLIFFECVKDEGANDQLVIGDKMGWILDCILLDNLSIRVEKIIRPRLDYIPFAFF